MSLVVVLVRARNPLNIGAVARAMSNFAVADLRCVGTYQPSFREAKSAVDADLVMQSAQVFSSLAEAVADCTFVIGTSASLDRDLATKPKSLHDTDEIRTQIAKGGRAALLFGSEKTGLSREELSYCHNVLRIPTRPEHGSMNLGQAAAVVLYELTRKPIHAEHEPHARARGAELQRLEQAWLSSLQNSGYVKPNTERASTENLRALIRRLDLSEEDAGLLTGMWSKVLKQN